MPTKYLDSTNWASIQIKAANIYVADTNVPCVYLFNLGTPSLVSGLDIVVTTVGGILVPRTISAIGDGTYVIYFRDPAQDPSTGGTQLYVQWGGESVNVANDVTVWSSNYGGSAAHDLVLHCEETSADLTDESGNYSPTDENLTYNQTGAIVKAPSFNGTTSRSDVKYVPVVNPTNTFTLVAFINPTAANQTKDFWGAKNQGVLYFQIRTFSEDVDIFVRNSASTNFTSRTSGNNITTGYQLITIAKRADGKFYVYRNDTELAYALQPAFTGASPVFPTFYFGGGNGGFWDGLMDEGRIIDTDLSTNQVKGLSDNLNGFATNASLTIGSVTSFSVELEKSSVIAGGAGCTSPMARF